MVEYRDDRDIAVERRESGGIGKWIAILLIVAAVIVGLLFATGFWSANVKEGALPKVDVSTKGGAMPSVDLDSKAVVVGTTTQNVEVPKMTTTTEQVEVPVVGVKDNGEK